MAVDTGEWLDTHRVELTGYCYRMLGSGFEAEDAVQETLVRALRAGYDPARGSLRAWLYSIATNVCVDMLRSAQRRALAMDLGPASEPGPDLGAPLPQGAWVQPVPDGRAVAGDPAEVAVLRETVRLAFVAALQYLPARQRAVLILREVLRFPAAEVARLLDTTVASVHSALQRARATLSVRAPAPAEPLGPEQHELLGRYVAAFERYDVPALVALMHEDATMSMPPFAWWLRGREHIAAALSHSDGTCDNARLVPTMASGSPAFGQYRWTGAEHEPFALVVLEVTAESITSCTTYLDLAHAFPLYGLPMSLPAPIRTNEHE
ncbi:RNA polymerase subunit sigma-70 [Actinophytocola xinjiangensis]|uniref:RNA polymerase subunit sigma-70 n=1 Tax=Actinophytocola xinjiangensis TaxID=485602 RepID=A0A7Z0WFJ5_9PSEU|nr:sigma-70 family RNA polymerase sigma factor [Actinophytocola xinjiangensis]OLF06145.1 RNA polymerase subunit sigma-70 [Actinophytocola xinjiangensis]